MAPIKKIVLKPKPVPKKKGADAPAAAPAVKSPADLRGLVVATYRITFEDGTYLEAVGELADVIWKYLNRCEQVCAEQQLINFLAPSFTRYAADGTPIATGVPLK